MAGAVHQIWIERNQRIFQQKTRDIKVIIRAITQEVHYGGIMKPRLAKKLEELNFYP